MSDEKAGGISYQELAAAIAGGLAGSIPGAAPPVSVNQSNQQSQTLQFNPNILVGPGTVAANPANYSTANPASGQSITPGGAVPSTNQFSDASPVYDPAPAAGSGATSAGILGGFKLDGPMLFLLGAVAFVLWKKKGKR